MGRIENVILFQIDQTNKVVKSYSQRELDSLGIDITVEQWVLLKIVSENTDLTQRELANKSRRDPASITRTLDILSKKGFISREKIPENRRSYHITLTKTGTDFISKNMKVIKKQRQQSIKGFSKEELDQLSSYLLRIQENMK